MVTWAIALSVWRYGHVEARWEASAAFARAERGEPELTAVSALPGQTHLHPHAPGDAATHVHLGESGPELG